MREYLKIPGCDDRWNFDIALSTGLNMSSDTCGILRNWKPY